MNIGNKHACVVNKCSSTPALFPTTLTQLSSSDSGIHAHASHPRTLHSKEVLGRYFRAGRQNDTLYSNRILQQIEFVQLTITILPLYKATKHQD